MKYISEKGTVRVYHQPITAKRTLSFRMNKPMSFDPNVMIRIVDEEGEGLVKELRFLNKFRHPDKGLAHSYSVLFEVPWNQVSDSRSRLNLIMVRIEDKLEKECDVSYSGGIGQGRHRRDWMPEEV